MTRKEAIRQTHQADVVQGLGFTSGEADTLRRISMTLHRWYEQECGIDNGCIERDDDTELPYWRNARTGNRYRIPDRENGAIRRLKGIMEARNGRQAFAEGSMGKIPVHRLSTYLQTDPRGASLYILRPGDVPEGGDVSSYYSRGICVY